LKQYKTTLAHRESQKKYRLNHLTEQREAKKRWEKVNPQRVKAHHDKYNPHRIRFLGKRISLDKNPRTGRCDHCHRSVQRGEIKRTNLHHIQYDLTNELEHTIELCVRCHNEAHGGRRGDK